MIEYELKEIKLNNNQSNYIPIFKDKDKEILTHFLSSECRNFHDDIIKCLNSVLAEQNCYAEFQGNTCMLSADKDNAIVECIIKGADVGEPCTIDTTELKSLIEFYYLHEKITKQ
jgi:hypothetical protein